MSKMILTSAYVRSRLTQFDNAPRYFGADRAIKLVIDQWPENKDVRHVLIKTVLINRLYSTNIYGVYEAAGHIFGLRIDERLRNGDITLVNDLADMTLGERDRYNLSFASKYCAWHQPDHFQIFDSNVVGLLWHYQKMHNFAEFKRKEIYDYRRFVEIIERFQIFFGLQRFSRKKIDKFLWIEARRRKTARSELV